MIYQGLFNILDLYLNQMHSFYSSIDNYFQQKIKNVFGTTVISNEIKETHEKIISMISEDLSELGLTMEDIDWIFSRRFSNGQKSLLSKSEIYVTALEIYNAKISSVLHEFFLEKIFEYLADEPTSNSTIMYLKSKNFLTIEFMMELRNLKSLYDKAPKKKKNLGKYLKIREEILYLLKKNREKIEELEEFSDPRDRLQLFYMIFRIIDFFGIQTIFDFSKIKNYIQNNIEEWLETLPLVTLKNPDLYYCGIYLAKGLDLTFKEEDEYTIKYFLLSIYDENIDEFEAPVIEATNKVDYFLRSSLLMDLELSEEQVKELLKIPPKFLRGNHLKNLETSQLVLILQMYNIMKVKNVDSTIVKMIMNEIEQRISTGGIKQFREGFITSEATYYVMLCNYMQSTMNILKDYDLIDKLISRIFRNLGILVFTEETNYDLLSEIFFSCEALKLLNCGESITALIHLVKYLFPQDVLDKILIRGNKFKQDIKFNNLKISRLTGENLH